MLGDMTIFDHEGNFNLYYLDENRGSVYQRVARLNELDMSGYNRIYTQQTSGRLLDTICVYADSADDYYDLMLHCISPSGLYSYEFPKDKLMEFRIAKSRFFASVREQGSISMPNHISSNGIPLSDVTAAINPGSLALLSIPAYMVLSLANFITIDREQTIGRGYYQTMAPPRLQNIDEGSIEIYDFDGYAEAFHFGNFLTNDSDLFLTVYGLAHSIAHIKWQIENSDMRNAERIENLVDWEPFTTTWNRLVEVGAMLDPFKEKSFGIRGFARFGVLNGDELNPDLHAALMLTELLSPCFSSPGEPWAKLAIFYGLMEAFPLRNYFGIDYGKEIKFAE